VIWYRIDKKSGTGKLRDNLIVGLSNLFNIIYVIALILAFLTIFGFNPKEVFTSLSIIAAAIAIIAKDFIVDIVIGLYNGFSTKIELDDYVKLGEYKGKITDIGLQKVTLQSDDDDIIYIPNQKFYNYEIINYTKKDIRTMSIEFSVAPKYKPNLNVLENLLNETLKDFANSIEENSPKLNVVNINSETIDFKYQYILKSVSREVQRDIKKKLMRRLIEAVNK
jgi:small-conductance mechanosensitive channel